MRAEAPLLAIALHAGPALAQELAVGKVEHYTENRGWNEAGLGPTWQHIVSAKVTPAGFPTLVFAEQGGAREPLTLFSPDLYVLWKRAEPGLADAWRVSAERDGVRSSAVSPGVARPQQVPLATDVRVSGKGAEPRLTWKLPALAGFDVERIRVGVRGGEKVQGRFLSLLWESGDLPPIATRFDFPPGILKHGERYIFQVMLEDLENGALENRSLAFSDPYTP